MKKYKVSWCLKVKNSELQKVIDFCLNVCGYKLAHFIDKNNPMIVEAESNENVFVIFNRYCIGRNRWRSATSLYFDSFEKFVERHIERSKSQKEI